MKNGIPGINNNMCKERIGGRQVRRPEENCKSSERKRDLRAAALGVAADDPGRQAGAYAH